MTIIYIPNNEAFYIWIWCVFVRVSVLTLDTAQWCVVRTRVAILYLLHYDDVSLIE